MALWHPQKTSEGIFRPMKFILRAETDDGLLLYNIVSSEMVLLGAEEKEVFERSPAEYKPNMDDLITRHFLVPDSYDENRFVLQLREVLKKLEPSKRVSAFTILPTTECNARCYYCFESDYPRCTMTDQIAEDTVAYIAKMCKGEPIEITWFGGEPLVGRNRISQICAGLRQKEIKYRSTMVSNAYLFDKELIRTAKDDWNLISLQITLDGTEAVYNATKAYLHPKDNPYQRVMKNIEDLLDSGVSVNVRLNVTDKNYADLSELIDELSERFGGRKGFTCYSHAIYEDVGFEPLAFDKPETVDAQTVALDVKLKNGKLLGSLSRLPSLRVIHCMSDNESARLIYPDGTIGKCENKSSKECIGDIYQDIVKPEMNEWYKAVERLPQCLDCCFYPDCICLKACPETGECSQTKVEWKKRRYTELMMDSYLKHKQGHAGSNSIEATQIECGS